jgi:hypothetical protein
MTVPATARRAGPYNGNGSTTSFSFSFKTFATGDLLVTKMDALGVETTLVLSSDYSVSLNPDQDASPGGTITYPLSGSPLPTGSKLTIVGDLDYEQTTDLLGGGAFNARVIEDTFDRTVIQIQQLEERLDRALLVPVNSTANVQLPNPEANQLIGWDSGAAALQNYALSEIATAIAYGTSRYDTFVGNGSTTQFALTEDPAALANLDVSISGVTQVPGTDYSLTSATLVFTSAPPNGAVILARYGRALPVTGPVDASAVSFVQSGTGAVTRTAQAKVRETVSVKDFGAVGDGIADDTAAIQAALTSHLAVDFGGASLVYKISSALVVQSGSFLFGNGATIRQVTNVTSILNIVGKTNVYIDGLTFDDTGAGYVTNDGNPHAAVFGGAGTQFVTVTRCKFTKVTYAAIRFVGSSNITVKDNTIIGPGVATLPSATNLRCYAVLFDAACNRFVCNDNQMTGTTIGIRIEQATNGVCNGNNIFDIPGQHGFYVGAACSNLTIAGNAISVIALQGIKIQAENTLADVLNIAVVGNTIISCLDSAITTSNGAGGTSQPAKVGNVTIEGNTIRTSGASGINIQNTVQGVISGNSIQNCTLSGISFSACDHILISSNVITSCALSGIRDQSASPTFKIDNNTLHNCATANTAGDRFGIFIQTLGRCTISNNLVTSATATMQYACYLAAGDQTTTILEGNKFFDAYEVALRVASSSTAFLSYKNNALYGTLGKAFNSPALPVVASAATITLPTESDVIRVTGTTNITTINTAGHTGHRVTLLFDNVLTVTRGSTIYAASNFVTSQFDTITFVCDGDYWFEVSRSVN